jgi:hypothetical protein
MTGVKMIVAGSRTIQDRSITFWAIDDWRANNPDKYIAEIISGKAKGPDTHAIEYAQENNIPCVTYVPEWDTYGKRAGFLRNIEMSKAGDECIVVYDGSSRGTQHMIRAMEKLDKPVFIYIVSGQ